MNHICCIIGGVATECILPENAFIIAADKGYAHLKDRGIRPHLVVGDFDSLGYRPKDIPLICHPIEKDDTDTLLAIKEGWMRGYRCFLLYGCWGGTRPEHSIANLQALSYIASLGGKGFLIEGDMVITAICDQKIDFDENQRGDISVFCLGADAQGVDIQGLHYQLTDAALTSSFPLGISNHFEGKAATISVKKGILHILWRTDVSTLIRNLPR